MFQLRGLGQAAAAVPSRASRGAGLRSTGGGGVHAAPVLRGLAQLQGMDGLPNLNDQASPDEVPPTLDGSVGQLVRMLTGAVRVREA